MVASSNAVLVGQQKTLCVGRGFGSAEVGSAFPAAVLSQTADFAFALEPELDAALQRLHREPDVALLLLDADSESLPQVLSFLHEARRLRPRLPIIAFSDRGGDAMRYLLRDGATWHFTKRSRSIAHLARALRRHAPLISENRCAATAFCRL